MACHVYLSAVGALRTVVPTGGEAATGWEMLERGKLALARAAFWRQAEAADAHSDVERLASAALGLGGIWVHEHRSTLEQARVAALQRRALGSLEALDPDSSLAHRLRTRLTAEQAYTSGEVDAMLGEVDAARARGVPIELAEALSLAHHCVLGPEHAALRLALADELIAISPSTGRSLDGLLGLAWRTVDLVLAGDRRALRSIVELHTQLDDHPCAALEYLAAALDVMLAMRKGRLADAELLAERCAALGADVGDADALGWYGAHIVAIRWMQGRAEDVLPFLTELVTSPTVAERSTGFDAALAALAAAVGDRPTAATALASLRAEGLGVLPSSSIWVATLHGACEAAHALGDGDAAAEAYDLLLPFADLPVMAGLGVACFGSAHRPLALAALTTGRIDRAVEHLEAALSADQALGNLPCVAIDAATLAGALRRRARPDDAARAAILTDGAIADARRFGMGPRAEKWAGELRRGGPLDIECRRDGRLWRVRVGETDTVVPHSVGMSYLGALLANPGVEITAVELATGQPAPAVGGVRQPLLDDTAKVRYRRRLEELQADVADAEACADLERAAAARATLDRFVDELTAATGLGGRDRCFADEAERARVSVHKAIKRALATISEANPCLGRALTRRIVTGVRCQFRAA